VEYISRTFTYEEYLRLSEENKFLPAKEKKKKRIRTVIGEGLNIFGIVTICIVLRNYYDSDH